MATMKQLWWVDWDQIELREVEIPQVKPNEVKVKVAYAALCATDVHQVTMGVMNSKPPAPLGHEASGTIVELGEQAAAAGYKVGDKVTMFPVSHCGECEWCKKGMTQYCINSKPTGAFAEYVVTDVKTIYKLPDNVELRDYAIVEPTNCCLRAMDLAPIRHGATVCVAGVGGIGSIMLNQILLSGWRSPWARSTRSIPLTRTRSPAPWKSPTDWASTMCSRCQAPPRLPKRRSRSWPAAGPRFTSRYSRPNSRCRLTCMTCT